MKIITDSLNYFSFFRYCPTVEEYWRFYPKFIRLKGLEKILQKRGLQIKKGRVVGEGNKKFLAETLRRAKISEVKLAKRLSLIKFLGHLPGVKFIGVSGTVSVLNANYTDDIDLFIISQKNRLWTARFWLVLITSLLRVRRVRQEKNPQDKLCLNLFFDEGNLKIPKKKQTEYVAHEVLQLAPIVNKRGVYERFLEVNAWVYKFFPNASVVIPEFKRAESPEYSKEIQYIYSNNKIQNMLSFRATTRNPVRKAQSTLFCCETFLTHKKQVLFAFYYLVIGKLIENCKLKTGNLWESYLKNLQLTLIKRHRTTEIITDKQLWFFPEDFEHKLKVRRYKVRD